MKQNFTYCYIACLCAALFLSACADDWDVRRGHVIQEGVPVTVSLDFGVSASKVVTRAAESEETERTVNRVYVFAFNSDGSLDNKMLYSPSSSTLDCIELDFPMHSGYDKRFYAVANPTSGSGTLGTETLARIETEEELLACTSSLLVPTNIERSYFLMSGKMEATEDVGQINVTETGQIQGAKLCRRHTVPVIELQRVDARITFKIKGKEGLNFVPDRYWVENIPQHTYVFPHDEDYVSDTPADDYASMSEYDVQRNVEGQDEKEYYMFEFYLAENRLQPAQRIETGADDTEGTKTLYALREKRLKTPLTGETGKEGQTEVNGAFKYANPHSAYVVFHGILSYTEEDGSYVYADATYTVHLGNTGSAADANSPNNPEFVNNYDTERNTHYTYTVTITGVESMRVEVEDDKVEQRPGVEGDLIFSGDAVREMDAHYGRTQFKLNKQNILDGLSWAIRTPFQNGMNIFPNKQFKEIDGKISTNRTDYTADQWQSLQTDLDLNDYKWVQFVINKEAGFSDGQLAKYPGYQCYCDLDNANVIAPPFGSEGAVPLSEKNYPNRSKKVVLYDVNQLVNHLYAEAMNDGELFKDGDEVTITAFVDEYVYVYDPTQVYYRSPLSVKDSDKGVDLTLWRQTVNRNNRMLYLCTSGSQYSPDGETSVSRNVFTIAQKPIYTFYNANDPSITNGWGTESINETGPISPTPKSPTEFSNPAAYPNGLSNGLFNTLGVLYNGETPRNLKWDEIMHLDADDRGDEEGTLNLQEPYNSIWYACIARNRDLNGDNIVDKDEVRWYLASIDQLTDIWIGQNSLNESAWLYHGDGRVRSHVASSSYYTPENPGPDNPYVIWAEEGASRGGLSGSTSFNGGRTTGSSEQTDADVYGNKNRYHYRCVRNLGISLDSPETPFDRYVTVKEDSYTNREGEQFDELVLSLDGMESNSIRSAIVQDAEQPAHNERDYVNRPYRKFAVIKKDHDYTLPDNRLGSWMDYQNVKVCPEGYRMPNQRELMLMYTSINETEHGMSWYDPSESYSYVCRTAFGYNNLYGGNRPGFMYEVKTGLLFLETDYRLSGETYARHPSGYVRCVRDVPN